MSSVISGFLVREVPDGNASGRQSLLPFWEVLTMSVTESKTKTERKSSRKPAKRRKQSCLPAGADGGSERAAGLTD